jgi:tRNA1(Val) A37 N6-methylase TrmN6
MQEYELEETKIFDVSIFQLKDKWKFSDDSIFLARFTAEIENKIEGKKKRLLEIGSGLLNL